MIPEDRIIVLWAEELARARSLIPSFTEQVITGTAAGSRRIGYCKNGLVPEVRVSIAILTEDKMVNTMRHELAHAIAWLKHRARGHGWEWMRICIVLGIEPNRCHDGQDILKPEAQIVVKCLDCNHSTGHARTTQAARSIEAQEHRYKCGKCKSKNLVVERPVRKHEPINIDSSVVHDYEIKRRPKL